MMDETSNHPAYDEIEALLSKLDEKSRNEMIQIISRCAASNILGEDYDLLSAVKETAIWKKLPAEKQADLSSYLKSLRKG